MTDFNEIMKQAKQMQERLQQAQSELANREVIGESGAGLVRVTMNGKHDVSDVCLDESLLKEDKAVIEDLLTAAINSAVRKLEETNKEAMGDMMGGMNLPEGFKFPF